MSEHAAAPGVVAAGSPLSPRALRELFFAPRRFFSQGVELMARPATTFVAWIAGVAGAIDRLDSAVGGGSNEVMLNVAHTWTGTWLFVLLTGILGGWMQWVVLGWWYRKRLEWCGADAPDPDLARSVWAYQTFVFAAPSVLWVLVATFFFANYTDASQNAGYWSILPLVFLFWSCITSYVGATSVFPKISRGKAAFWFLALPLLLVPFLVISLVI